MRLTDALPNPPSWVRLPNLDTLRQKLFGAAEAAQNASPEVARVVTQTVVEVVIISVGVVAIKRVPLGPLQPVALVAGALTEPYVRAFAQRAGAWAAQLVVEQFGGPEADTESFTFGQVTREDIVRYMMHTRRKNA